MKKKFTALNFDLSDIEPKSSVKEHILRSKIFTHKLFFLDPKN